MRKVRPPSSIADTLDAIDEAAHGLSDVEGFHRQFAYQIGVLESELAARDRRIARLETKLARARRKAAAA